jgi:Flp pilus assembly protein TadD
MAIRARGTASALLGLGLLVAGCASFEGARLYARGTDALDRGELGPAIAALERAATLVPEASEVHNHLGLAYARSGREGDALREFERAVELDCDNEAARHNLVAAQRRTGRGDP